MAETGNHSRPGGVERLASKLEKPLLDNRTYRVIRLPNQLEALIIHDADTDKASAAMDVNVGSFSDDAELPGMAHAVEHLLFMGTDKYPGENDYSSYLTKYGGYSNAFTAHTSTNYYFELSASATSNSRASSANTSTTSLPMSKESSPLYGGLDRFSQFFINPLFLEDTLDRELRAVDSENKKNLQSDAWRNQQLERSLANEKHPWNRFSTGNYEVLHDDPIARGVKIRDEFIGFYKRHYSANRMKLVVLGKEDLDTLQSWVEELFTDVPDQNLPQNRWDGIPLLSQKEVGKEIFIKPVMERRQMELQMNFPDEEPMWESKPSRYISHLIGHEGPGSLLAYLKGKGWVNELSAGVQNICPGASYMMTTFTLTEEGLQRYRDIAKAFFQYVAILRSQPPQQWIFDESAQLADVEFKFRQKIPASRTTSHFGGVMQKPLPRDKLLSGESLLWKFDAQAIKQGLDALTPDNFRILLTGKDASPDWPSKEKWYGTEYKVVEMPSDFRKELEATVSAPASSRPTELHLPHRNEFVPQRLDVEKKEVEHPATTPKLLRNDENVRVWHKKDDQFWVPKANIFICLRSPAANISPLVSMLSHMYKSLVDDSLVEYVYDAELAGLKYGLGTHSQGYDLQVSGYNDKMHVLLEKVLHTMRDLEVKNDRFEIVKERVARNMRNFDYMDPYRQIHSYTRWLSQERSWLQAEMLAELDSITADDVRAFIPHALQQMHIEMLVQGNLYKADALSIADLVERTLRPRRLPASQWPSKRAMIIPPGSDFRYAHTLKNPDNINHCIEYVLFAGSNSDRALRAKLLLMGQILDEPVFNTLRTKEQLGYVVGSGTVMVHTVQAFRIIAQSEKDCGFLEKRIDHFLNGFLETVMDEMSEEDFEKHKIGLINKRLQKLKNLTEEAGRMWHHVTSEAFDFDLVEHDVAHIEPLTKADLIDFYNTYFHPSSSTRAKISIHLVAQASADDLAAAKNIDPAEQRKSLVNALSQILGQLNLTADEDALTKRFEKVDLHTNAVENTVTAVSGYLKETAKLGEEQIKGFTDQGRAVLLQVFPQLGIKTGAADAAPEENGLANGHATNGEQVVMNGDSKKKEPVWIEDVRSWKAGLEVSTGAQPVRDLSEFMESEAKL